MTRRLGLEVDLGLFPGTPEYRPPPSNVERPPGTSTSTPQPSSNTATGSKQTRLASFDSTITTADVEVVRSLERAALAQDFTLYIPAGQGGNVALLALKDGATIDIGEQIAIVSNIYTYRPQRLDRPIPLAAGSRIVLRRSTPALRGAVTLDLLILP